MLLSRLTHKWVKPSSKTLSARRARRRPQAKPMLEGLEDRTLLSQDVGSNVNISKVFGNEVEPTIALDPTTAGCVPAGQPCRLFAASMFNSANAGAGFGLLAGVSSDGGANWTRRIIANGNGVDPLTQALAAPSAAFDRFGNLFLAYESAGNRIIVSRSTDGGSTFTQLADLGAGNRPRLGVGPDATGAARETVWIAWRDQGTPQMISVSGAALTALGLPAAPVFTAPVQLPSSDGGDFANVAVGPLGHVLVTYQDTTTPLTGPSNIFSNVDANGLGAGGFAAQVTVATTNVGANDGIPSQLTRRINAAPGLAYDRSGGTFNGRAYVVYTAETALENNNTEIFLQYSTDN